MTITIDALFDGTVFRPIEPIELEPNAHVRITVRTVATTKRRGSFLQTARSLKLDGPPDWSANIEEYLYHGATDHES